MREKLNSLILSNKFHLFALLILLIYLSPNIFIPHQAVYLIHDNLNSNVVWYKNLAESGKFFGANNEIVPRSLSGLPRGCYPSELNFLHLFYLIFSPLIAYNLNIVVIHLVAFYGMFLLANRYFFNNKNKGFAWGIALIYALIPFWPSGGLAITGQPLLLYALLNIYNRKFNWENWLIICLVPLYSLLILSNLFLFVFLGIIYIILCFRDKKLNLPVLLAFSLFIVISIISEHKLFEMQFIEKLESHRILKNNKNELNIFGIIGISLRHFLFGQYHFYSINVFIVLIMSVVTFYLSNFKQRLIIMSLLTVGFIISLIFVYPNFRFFHGITMRFHSVMPLYWICVLAYISFVCLSCNFKLSKHIVIIFLVLEGVITMFSINLKDYQGCEFIENSFYKTYFNNADKQSETFNNYYKIDLYREVKVQVPTGRYNIVNVGIQPEISQFNGYNTIDGYFFYYPKSYNTWFTNVCKKEMQKIGIKKIDSYCKIACLDLENNKSEINSLELDYGAMKKKNTVYIFSTKKINVPELSLYKYARYKSDVLYVYSIN